MTYPANSSTTHRYIAAALILITLALFHPAIHYDYVKLDDDQYIAQNIHVATGLRSANVHWAFTTVHEGWWLPLLWISYMVDTDLFGHRPFGYHLTNILLHAANAGLLFWVLYRLTGSRWKSAFVAALFALHPMRVEAVAWITSRKDVLSGLFFMLSLLAYIRYVEKPERLRYGLVALLMLAGLMSKAILIVLPIVLLLLDYWPLNRTGEATWRSLIIEKWPLFILSAVFTLIGLRTHIADTGATAAITPLTRLGLMFPNFWDYLAKIFWPAHLALIYPEHDVVHGPTAIAALIGLAAITALCLRWRRSVPALIVGWLWFLVALLPVIRGVRFGLAAYADRYTYLPIIGLGIALAWGATAFAPRAKPVLRIAAIAILIACAGRTHIQLPLWKDSMTMFSRLIEQAPDHFMANNNYGKALKEAGRIEESLPYFERAAELRPRDTLAIANLGESLVELTRDAEAVEVLARALRERDPESVNVHFVLGRAYLNLNQASNAIPHIAYAVQRHPGRVGWRIELVRAHFEAGQSQAAQSEIQRLIASGFPHIRSYNDLFAYYSHLWRQGEAAHAGPFFRHALERHANDPDRLQLIPAEMRGE